MLCVGNSSVVKIYIIRPKEIIMYMTGNRPQRMSPSGTKLRQILQSSRIKLLVNKTKSEKGESNVCVSLCVCAGGGM